MGSQVVLRPDGLIGPGRASARVVDHAPADRAYPQGLRNLGRIVSSLPLGTWALVDVIFLGLGIYAGYQWFVVDHFPPFAHVPMWQGGAILVSTFFFASLVFGLYERETIQSRSRILTRLMLTTATAIVLTYAIIYVLMYTTVSRRVVGMAVGCQMLLGGIARLTACYALHRVRRNIAIVGPGMISNSLVRAFDNGFLSEYRLLGYVDHASRTQTDIEEIVCLGNSDDLPEVCRKHDIDDIVVGAEAATDTRLMNAVLPCLRRGCRVTNEATFYEKATGQVLVDEINPHWFLFADLQVHCQRRQALKRAFDIVFSALGLLAALTLLPIIALAVKIYDRGPIFYSQLRVGQNGKPFRLYKFRTMKQGAETNEAIWASKNDPRITRVGRLLRRTRLDELPQLYNVLIGQMSLVGPRPERPDFVVRLSDAIPYFNERHLVKPGITGWAQIGFRYGASIEDAKRKLQFDLYYVKNMSIELDIMILIRTLGVFVRGAC